MKISEYKSDTNGPVESLKFLEIDEFVMNLQQKCVTLI